MDSNRIGAIAETAIAAEATQLGFDVYRPVAEGGRADFIIEADGRLVRVQCKTAVRRGEVIPAAGRRTDISAVGIHGTKSTWSPPTAPSSSVALPCRSLF